MNEYEKLEEEFKEKVRNLQKSCNHQEVTKWIEECGDMQYTGFTIKICKICNKVVNTKRPCTFCKKILYTEDRWDDPKYNFRCGWFCSEECHQKYIKMEKERYKKLIERAKKIYEGRRILANTFLYGKDDERMEEKE